MSKRQPATPVASIGDCSVRCNIIAPLSPAAPGTPAGEYKHVYEVQVEGEVVQGTVILDGFQAVLDEVAGHIDNLSILQPQDAPLTITIAGGRAATTVLTIRAKHMTQAEYDALPEHEGW